MELLIYINLESHNHIQQLHVLHIENQVKSKEKLKDIAIQWQKQWTQIPQ